MTVPTKLVPLASPTDDPSDRIKNELIKLAIDTVFFIDLVLSLLKLVLANMSFYPYLLNDADDALPSLHVFYNLWRLFNKNKKSTAKYIILTILTSCQAASNSLATYFVLHPWILPVINFAAAPLFFIAAAWFTAFRLAFHAIRINLKCSVSGLIRDRKKSLAYYEKIEHLTAEQKEKKDRLTYQLRALETNESDRTVIQHFVVEGMLAYERKKRKECIFYSICTLTIAIAATVMVFFPPAAPFSLIVIAGIVCGSMIALYMKAYCENLYTNWLVDDTKKQFKLSDKQALLNDFAQANSKQFEGKTEEYLNKLPPKASEALLTEHLLAKRENDNRALLIFQWWKYELSYQKPKNFRTGVTGSLKTLFILAFTPFIAVAASGLGLKDVICHALRSRKNETGESKNHSTKNTRFFASMQKTNSSSYKANEAEHYSNPLILTPNASPF